MGPKSDGNAASTPSFLCLTCRTEKRFLIADEAAGKLRYVRALDAKCSVCIGNGRNDRLMLQEAALGIAVLQTEGLALEALTGADMVTRNIIDALDLLRNPLRLIATLRD